MFFICLYFRTLTIHAYINDTVHVLVYLTLLDYTSSASGTGAKGWQSVTLGERDQTLPYVHLKEIVYKQILIWFSLNAGFFYLSRVSLITLIQAGRVLITLLLITNITIGLVVYDWQRVTLTFRIISRFMLSHWQNVSQIKTTKITQIYPLVDLCNKFIPLFLVNY